MSEKLVQGDRVLTPDFGEGTVVRTTVDEIVVQMDDYGSLELAYLPADLVLVKARDQTTGITAQEQTAAPIVDADGPLTPDIQQRRAAVEALRFGLVPPSCIENVTAGFSYLERWILDRLPHLKGGAPTFSEVCGPFGTGKSHTMAVVRFVAEREGYATAQVEVDGRRISFSDPESLDRKSVV